MFRKKIILFLILAATFTSLSCGSDKVTEKEPNDTFAQALPITLGEPVEGFLQSKNDRDVYKFAPEREVTLSLSLTGVKGINHAVSIYTVGRKFVKLVDDSRKSSPEFMANLSVPREGYYFVIHHGARDEKKGNSENHYVFSLLETASQTNEKEPNDFYWHAAPILSGESITGYFSPGFNRNNTDKRTMLREEDWFLFKIPGAREPLVADITLSGVEGVNSILQVYTMKRKLTASADNGLSGEGESITGLSLSHGDLYIVVASRNHSSGKDTPYSLSVTARERSESEESEPNDSFSQATDMNSLEMNGIISGSDDRDYFKVSNLNGIYSLGLAPSGDLNAVVDLLDNEEKLIYSIDNNGSGKTEVFPDLFLNGTYYLRITGRTKPDEGGYHLAFARVEDTGFLEREPNNSTGSATPWKGKKIEGFMSAPGDKDYFLINTGIRERLKFTVHGINDVTMKIAVTDPMGYVIKSVEVQGKKVVSFTEMVDSKGYCVVTFTGMNISDRYTIEMERK